MLKLARCERCGGSGCSVCEGGLGPFRFAICYLLFALFAAAASAQDCSRWGVPVDGRPSSTERAMLTLTNACRIAPIDYRNFYLPGAGDILLPEHYPAVATLVWADGLGASARAHCVDMAENGCFQHDSCDGTPWSMRVGGFYPQWSLLGENVAGGYGDPVTCIGGLLADAVNGAPAADGSGFDGHRWNIMSPQFVECGCGFATGPGLYARYYTQDFGRPKPLAAACAPANPMPSGSHVVVSGRTWLLVNVYDAAGVAPESVEAVVEGEPAAMALHLGTAARGTYRLGVADKCRTYHFRVVDAAGMLWRYPARGELLLGCSIDYARAGDFNADGVVDAADIFDFLRAWLGATGRADFDDSGFESVADIFVFVAAWFEG